jgi:hypothetical protein
MKIHNRLFDVDVPVIYGGNFSWLKADVSFWSLSQNAYPLMALKESDIENLPTPLWLWDLSANSEVGTFDETEECEYLVSGFDKFEDYFKRLNHGKQWTMKKFDKLIDVTIEKPKRAEIEEMYKNQFDRLNGDDQTDGYFEQCMDAFCSKNTYAYVGRQKEKIAGFNLVVKEEKEMHALGVVIPKDYLSGIGIYLNLVAIRDAIANGETYNLGYGKYPYKEDLCNEQRLTKQVICASKEFAHKIGVREQDVWKLEG